MKHLQNTFLKITCSLFLLSNLLTVNGQGFYDYSSADLGIAAGITFMNENYSKGFFNGEQTHISSLDSSFQFRQAIDVKATYLIKGADGFIPAVNQIGVQIGLAKKDSVSYLVNYNWSYGGTEKTVFVKSNPMQIELKFSYKLLPDLNEFALIYAGWGFGGHRNKLTYYCADEYQYNEISGWVSSSAPNDGSNIITTTKWGINLLFNTGVFYEFEKFRIQGEIGYSLNVTEEESYILKRQNILHGKLGIFIPLARY